jgi:hypothetical protein
MLRDGGLRLGELVIISRSTADGVSVRHTNAISLGSGAAVGVVWGSVVALGWLALGGMGSFIAAGALRVIGATLIGAAVGALMCGLAVALVQARRRSKSEEQDYAGMAEANKTLVAVQVRAGDARRAERTLTKAGAESVRAAQARAPAELVGSEGQRRDDEAA